MVPIIPVVLEEMALGILVIRIEVVPIILVVRNSK